MRPNGQAAYQRAIAALGGALLSCNPGLRLTPSSAVQRFIDNLIPGTEPAWFEAELNEGDGQELKGKFKAAHSSSALAANTFARFKIAPDQLNLVCASGFEAFRFEAKCPAISGRNPPNLDLLVQSRSKVVGVESKCTEHLRTHVPKFAPAYDQQITDGRRGSAWFQLMRVLIAEPTRYRRVDAAQLVKHAYGLAHCFPGQDVTLLYLYWEPRNAEALPELAEHREEVAKFAREVAGSFPSFAHLSYRHLWDTWGQMASPTWLPEHLAALRARYDIAI